MLGLITLGKAPFPVRLGRPRFATLFRARLAFGLGQSEEDHETFGKSRFMDRV